MKMEGLAVPLLLLITALEVCYGQPGAPCEAEVAASCPGVPCISRPLAPSAPADEPNFVCDCTVTENIGFDCSERDLGHRPVAEGGYQTCYGIDCNTGCFESPNYPGLYPNQWLSTYLLYIPGASRIDFSFTGEGRFGVEAQKDELYIGTGLSFNFALITAVNTSSPVMIDDVTIRLYDNLTANIAENPTTRFYPDPFSYETDTAWLYFRTDRNIRHNGWRLCWTSEVDTNAPVVIGCPDDIVASVTVGGQLFVSVTWQEPIANDISPPITTQSTHVPGQIFFSGTTPVTYTFADRFGNAAECVFNVNVFDVDPDPPVISNCPADIVRTVELGTTDLVVTWALPTATDFGGDVTVTQSHQPGDRFPAGQVTTVTYIFSDPSGNADTCIFTVNVMTRDTTPPDIQNCPDDIVETIELGSGSTRVFWLTPMATDISGNVQLVSNTRNPGDEFQAGTTVSVIYIFGDSDGNEATCQFLVTVRTVDTTPPNVAGCPAPIIETVQVDQPGVAIQWVEPTFIDADNNVDVDPSHMSGQFFLRGQQTTVTYQFTDTTGNSATCRFCVDIISIDTVPPVITGCPPDQTVTIELGEITGVAFWVAPMATDNSGTANLQSNSHSPGDEFTIGDTTVIYQFIDPTGNPSTCMFLVRVVPDDTVAPTIENCPTAPVEVTVELGSPGGIGVWTEPNANDISGVPMLAERTHAPGELFPIGPTRVNYTFRDSSDNTATCSFLVIVNTEDTTPPTISGCPQPVPQPVELGVSQRLVTWVEPMGSDLSPPVRLVSRSHAPNSPFPVGLTTVTYVFEDRFQNREECVFTVIVVEEDTQGPVISGCVDVEEFVECNLPGGIVSWTEPIATDLSGMTTLVSRSHVPGTFFSMGTTVVEYTFIDINGNTESCTFPVIVTPVDTTPPDVLGPDFIQQPIEVGAPGVTVEWTEPIATDLCGATILVSQSHTSGQFFPGQPTTVTYMFRDERGNSATYVFCIDFIRIDTTPPVVPNCPDDIGVTVELGEPGQIMSWTEPTATDLSGTAVLQSRSNAPGSLFVIGVTVVTYTFADGDGNTVTCEFMVTVTPVDTTPPDVTGCPDNINMEIELGETSAIAFWPEPAASDVSGVAMLVSRSSEPGDRFSIGPPTTVTYVFRDDSNNVASCIFTVTITTVDRTPPVIENCPGDILRTIERGLPGAVVAWTEPSASDISQTQRLVMRSRGPGELYPEGLTTITYVFEDASGNSATCEFNIIITTEDTTPPTITGCPTDVGEIVELGTPGTTVEWMVPSASDLSPPVIVQTANNPGDFFLVGAVEVTYTFIDNVGNDATCSFTVTVTAVDRTPPTISDCPMQPVTSVVELGVTSTMIVYLEPTATDASNAPNLLQTSSCQSGGTFPVGDTTCFYLFRDPTGNMDNCQFNIIVTEVDTVPPTIMNCPLDGVSVVVELGIMEGRAAWPEPTATDLAGASLLSRSSDPGSLFPLGQTLVTYIFTDPSDNTASCNFVVDVTTVDTTPPVVSNCPADIRELIELGSGGTVLNWVEPTATDLSNVVTVDTTTIPVFFTPGTVMITYTFTDLSGNTAECSFNVVVVEVDTTPPEINLCPTPITDTVELGNPTMIANWPEPTATDSSGVPQLVSRTFSPGDPFPVGSTTVEYLFRDTTGNTATCQCCVTIIEVDTTPPVCMNLPGDVSMTVELGVPGLSIDIPEPTCFDTSRTGRITARSHNPGDFFGVGNTAVTYTCSDESDNRETCFLEVRIATVDTTPPDVVGCPNPEVTVTIELGTGPGSAFWAEPQATDVSGSVDVMRTHAPGDAFPVGMTTVMYTFTDASNNMAFCTFRVLVEEEDTIPPEIMNCPSMIDETIELGTSGRNIEWVEPTATDRSGTPMLVVRSHAPGAFFPVGVSQVEYTFRDSSGNEAVCAFMILISEVDTTPPDCVNIPADVLVTTELGTQGTTASWVEPTCRDISAVANVSERTHTPGTFFLIGTTDVVYTCTDGSANSRPCPFSVTVAEVDTTPPVVTCPADITVNTIAGAETVYVDYSGDVFKTDNSGQPSLISIMPESGSDFPVGTTMVVITVSDPSNNVATCTFSVTVFEVDPCDPEPCQNGGYCVVDSITEFRCICPDCFTGDLCQFPVSACDGNDCQSGGQCVEVPGSCTLFTCDCPECFSGDRCQNFRDACDNNECQNGAQCVPSQGCVSYTCQCPDCFEGPFCQIPINPCSLVTCANGAQCIPGPGNDCTSFSCLCTGCFSGVFCDIAIDPCQPNPCQNGATCSRDPANCQAYTCDCVGCFNGPNCESFIPNPCFQSPCQNFGVCSQIPGSCTGYRCDCVGAFGGFNCQTAIAINQNPCNSFPCEAGATCLPTSSGYLCVCRDGYAGINCGETTGSLPFGRSACTSNPCVNGATCRNSFDSASDNFNYESQYTCMCADGFTGVNCQIPTVTNPAANVCLRQGCQNGEPCVNIYNSFSLSEVYSCQCEVGAVGQDCEIPVDNPCQSNPCQNSAPCRAFNTYFMCVCINGFSGDFCQLPPDTSLPLVTNCPPQDVVVQTPGSTAVATWPEPIPFGGDDTELVYQSHMSGEPFPIGQTAVTYVYRDINGQFTDCCFFVVVREINRCLGIPCWNGGRCLETGPTVCDCTGTGFTGPSCSDSPIGTTPCSPNPCLNGGTCIEDGAGFRCLCEQGFMGNTCADSSGLTCPADITIESAETLTSVQWTEPSGPGLFQISRSHAPGDAFPIGTTEVTYSYFNQQVGAQQSCSFFVTVNQLPSGLTCPADITIESAETLTSVQWTEPSGLGLFLISRSHAPGDAFPIGTTEVTYTFFNQQVGAQQSCSFFVTVNQLPSGPPCPSNTTADTAGDTASVQWTEPESGTTTGFFLITRSNVPGDSFPVGTTEVTYTFFNLMLGMQQSCSFFVTVNQQVVQGPCNPNPCLNNGVCTVSANGIQFTCNCAAGFDGNTCADESVCAGRCENGGTCFPVAIIPAGYVCLCPGGTTGETCPGVGRKRRDVALELTIEDDTDTECLCQNGGVCAFGDSDFCLCPEQYEGALCEDLKVADTFDQESGNPLVMPLAIGLLVFILLILIALSCVAVRMVFWRPRPYDQRKLIIG